MSLANHRGETLLSLPSHEPHGPRNTTCHTVVIKPTEEYQSSYNKIRRRLEEQDFRQHVTEENEAALPRSAPMSRSTSDSRQSSSTMFSPIGEDGLSNSPGPPTEGPSGHRPPRGRRRGRLSFETRVKTAFKREWKLTCGYAQEKRIKCKCHDFSALERGYNELRAVEALNSNAEARAATRSEVSAMPYSDIGTFVTGVVPPSIPNEQEMLDEMANNIQLPAHMEANLPAILTFDIDSEASVSEMVSTHSRQPSFFFVPPHQSSQAQSTTTLVAIGCTVDDGLELWQCQFLPVTDDELSVASAGDCSWTGSFDQLSDHFMAEHYPFDQAEFSSLCTNCNAKCAGWGESPECNEETNCPRGPFQIWYWGRVTRQIETQSPVTVSGASWSQYSGFQDQLWGSATPGSSNTEQSNGPYNTSWADPRYYAYGNGVDGNKESDSDSGSNSEAGDIAMAKTNGHPRKKRPSLHWLSLGGSSLSPSWHLRDRSSSIKTKRGPVSTYSHAHLREMGVLGSWWRSVFSYAAALLLIHVVLTSSCYALHSTLLAVAAGVYLPVVCVVLTILGVTIAWASLWSPYRRGGRTGQ
ncbi:hypothetical protein GGS20DRAFT_586771 [Poronia punctata]|nr:hypothetical protein GGS20DRAFT_586771 [Poronia punctata]